MTIERYFAIVHPLKHFSAKKFLLLASVVAALLYNVPKFYEFEKKVRLCLPPTQHDRKRPQGCQMAKFDPFLSSDCARVEGIAEP